MNCPTPRRRKTGKAGNGLKNKYKHMISMKLSFQTI
jgi:hypothetical protein